MAKQGSHKGKKVVNLPNLKDQNQRYSTRKKHTVASPNIAYENFFSTEEYHITNGKGHKKNEFSIIPNNTKYMDNKFSKVGNIDIHRFSTRPSIVDKFSELIDARFDKFETSPSIYSKSHYNQNISFARQAGRLSVGKSK